MATVPTRELELSLLERSRALFKPLTAGPSSSHETENFAPTRICIAGIDEVGRGAIAGPLAVGIAVIDGDEGEPPAGLTDSKQLTAKRREAMFEELAAWPAAWAVGTATATEIDKEGLTPALRLAAFRALDALAKSGYNPQIVLLDGSFDYLTPPSDLFSATDSGFPSLPIADSCPPRTSPKVTTLVKGDAKSVVIAAASVLAKVSRDRLMSDLADPGYGWAKNKGYASAQHMAAISQLGLDSYHRLSWTLQGVSSATVAQAWNNRRERPAQSPQVFSTQKG